MTTKANTDKIGHKGSGLKFTLAYLHRLGGCLQARSVDYHLRSEIFTARIRDVDHQMIRLRSAEGDQLWEAHITTQAGADTWTEPWFILREMLQNAIDEGGEFGLVEEDPLPETAGTILQIPLTPELEQAWPKKDRWMQPRYPHVAGRGHPDSKGLYYHGFLIYSAGQKWKLQLRRDAFPEAQASFLRIASSATGIFRPSFTKLRLKPVSTRWLRKSTKTLSTWTKRRIFTYSTKAFIIISNPTARPGAGRTDSI